MIKVLMVDEHIMVREGIKRIIDDTNDIDIVAEAASGDTIICGGISSAGSPLAPGTLGA